MSGKHILLAEDEEHVRYSLTAILKKAGYNVTAAVNGREALEKITELKANSAMPDLLLTDIKMPEMSGIELMDALEKQNIPLPVFAITGYGDKETVVELLRRGCRDYIDKPFDPKELLTRLPRIFDRLISSHANHSKDDAEKAKAENEQIAERFFQEKTELNRQMDAYIRNFDMLRKQMDSAVGAYRNLTQIRQSGYKVHIAYHQQALSELGGDFTDVRDMPSGTDILLADVAGHDMGASFHTVMIKAFFDENCRTGNDGKSFFRLLNRQLLENGRNERMVTAVFLRLNLKEMTGEVVSAGHPPCLRLAKETSFPDTLMTAGDVLGIYDDVVFADCKFPLYPGDRFFLHTDGLTDAYRISSMKRSKLEIQGLRLLIKQFHNLPLEKMIGHIAKSVTACYKFNDDVLLLGAEIP
ncbi:MAG: hypothetical protein BWK80_26485 [Desulfobacteraceae bacterium IS3]|nr:MAG: hypothetical protein BWK80_26485 [Desulfobacteraceae bacterium IS3]